LLTYPEISQLSNHDLTAEITNARNSLFRQKIGVKTKHLKATHKIRILKKFIARLLTENIRRQKIGQKITNSDEKIAKKLAAEHVALAKLQAGKKKKQPKNTETKPEKITEDSGNSDVKVINVDDKKKEKGSILDSLRNKHK
jgi:ribosomal protein L29